MALQPMIIRSQPGIKRDGTVFQGEYYVDGQWVRFQRQLPRKIGGYTTTNRFLPEICRGLKTYTVGNYTYIFTGGASKLQYHTVDLDGNSSILVDRTPATIDVNQFNLWQFDIIVDTSLVPPVNQIVAHVSPNAQSLSNTEGGQIFIGNLIDETPLLEFTPVVLNQFVIPTGGIVSLHPYLVVYGNDGSLAWSAPGRPTVFYGYEYEETDYTLALPAYTGQGQLYVNPQSASWVITFTSVNPPSSVATNFITSLSGLGALVPGGSTTTASYNILANQTVSQLMNDLAGRLLGALVIEGITNASITVSGLSLIFNFASVATAVTPVPVLSGNAFGSAAPSIYAGQTVSQVVPSGVVPDLANRSLIINNVQEFPYETSTQTIERDYLIQFSPPARILHDNLEVRIGVPFESVAGSPISVGSNQFRINGDYADELLTSRVFQIQTLSTTNTVYVVQQAAYEAATSQTIITIEGTFQSAYNVGAIVYFFLQNLPDHVRITANVSVGQSYCFVNQGTVGAIPIAGQFFILGQDPYVYSVSSNTRPLIATLELADATLFKSYPSNSPIFEAGNAIDTGAGNARIASQKIVKGLPLRGGPGNSPSGIFWSTDAVLRMSFVGGDLIFQFDTISAQSSILSAASVIEHDGIYYWVGTDRFLVFNGVVRELPNDMNINWFFDNLNRSQSQRVFSFKIPRYSEIWWCFPFGNAVECTHAVIYNIRENTWYDTKLPNNGRSAAEFIALFGSPIMTGVDATILDEATETNAYRLWAHERGTDEVDGQDVFPVDSYFTTADFSLISQAQGKLKNLRVAVMEPDFIQSGNMTVEIIGRANARSKETTGPAQTFPAYSFTTSDQVVYFKEERRILRFKFRSNTVGGNYEMGQIVAHIEEADGTYLGGSQ